MEPETIKKNGASPKSHTSRGNILKFVATLLAVLTTGYAQAQYTYFGLRAGGNLASISGTYVPILGVAGGLAVPSFKPGFLAGIVVEHAISYRAAVQFDLLFVQQGTKFAFASENIQWDINYLQIPVDFKVKFRYDGKFYVKAGFNFGYALSGKHTSDKSGAKDIDLFKAVDLKSDDGGYGMKRIDIGWAGGFGWEFGAFQIDIYSNLGLMNLLNPDDWTSISNLTNTLVNTRNLGMSLNLIYLFGKY